MGKKKWKMSIVSGILITMANAVYAGVPSYDMEEIVVTAAAVVNTIGEETINKKYVSPGKAATIPELLSQCTGIDIQQRTSYGDNQDSTVKLRGFDARRYTVLLDGRQINSAGVMGGQYIDWNSIPLDMVDKIQIIKGGKTAEHGNTLGGTINIITKKMLQAAVPAYWQANKGAMNTGLITACRQTN